MRNAFGFAIAGEMVFGNGSVNKLGSIVKKLGGSRVLVVTDPGLAKAGLLATVEGLLKDAGVGVVSYDRAEPEPRVARAVEGYQEVKGEKCDLVVGLGGGSSMDIAKTLALLLTHGGEPADYFGESKVPGPVLPLVAIPTTAGTGSEITPSAVLTDEVNNVKVGISDNYLRPRVALVDPLLTLELPPAITASTGMDALCHAVEAFTGIDYRYLPIKPDEEVLYHGSNQLTNTLAREAIRLIGGSLRTAVDQGRNVEARHDMALGSVTAALAYSNSGVGAAHALAYPVGALTHAPHGVLCGLLLPHVMQYNLPVRMEKLAEIAVLLGENTAGLSRQEAAQKGVDAVKSLIRDIKMTSRLRDLGVTGEDIPGLAEKTMGVTRLLRNNPRRASVEGMAEILTSAL
ncbi:alcohol dehydrogenase [Clostridiales bacterium PH28_bin88]|nr:alcohol dehydrogenase [Clostridiales bacterium PH28_bin88]